MENSLDKWLKNFLETRDLNVPDGRHLFSYRATPDEFLSLEEILKNYIADAGKLQYDNPFKLWNGVSGFNPSFVLYAALSWQQRYGGTTWSFDVILKALNVSVANPSQALRDIIKRGLEYWKLSVNDRGYVYLGAIAREAGLPQKLLAESRGALGSLLHDVLKEALRSDVSGDIIADWIESYKSRLPQSYWNKEIVGLLADSITAILTIRKNLRATTAEEAIVELNEKDPDWRSLFPLPLYDDAARDLLNSLLETATAQSREEPIGKPVSVYRYIAMNSRLEWRLQARLEIPANVKTGISQGNPRLVTLSVVSGQSSFESVLRRCTNNSGLYTFHEKPEITFSGSDASEEITVEYITPSGFRIKHTCLGGTELDADLSQVRVCV